MMDFQWYFSALAGVLFILAFLPYIRSILRGKTKPKKSSWLVWTIVDTITMAGMWASDSLNGQIIGAVIGAGAVTVFAFKKGESGWSWLDKVCLIAAGIGLILWPLTNDPITAIVVSLTIVVLAAIPTFVGAWHKPEEENRLAWTIYWVSCVFAILAIPAWTIADAAQPIAFMFIESVMMLILWVKPVFMPH